MLKTLMDLLNGLQPPPTGASDAADAADAEHTLQLATAVMLVEVMRADSTFENSERATVLDALRNKFALTTDEAQRLAELAETTARQATDLYAFTSRINQRFDMPAKLRMVELMWGVAHADGHLSAHERHVMWRIADLLHVPQGAYHHARQRARQQSPAS